MLKSQIRSKIIKIRKIKNTNNIKLNPSKIFQILNSLDLKNKIVGGYYPVNFEMDDLQILKELENKDFKISLPIIKKNNKMDFYLWSSNNLLFINKYGIPEPENTKLVKPDIIFVPLVAFDQRLFRIGYGEGYYDRYIEKISRMKNLIKIGIAHSSQKIKKIPNNKYDKKMDIIITEKFVLK